MPNRFGDAPVSTAPSPRVNRFGDSLVGGTPTPGPSQFAAQRQQDADEIAQTLARGEIGIRQKGLELLPSAPNYEDGSQTFTPQQTRPAAPLNPSEKLAIIQAYRTQYGGNPQTDQTYDQMSNQVRYATAQGNSRLEDFSGAAAASLAQIGTGVAGIVAPEFANRLNENLGYNYDPDSYAAIAGQVVGNTLPLVPALLSGAGAAAIGNTTAGVLGAGQFGSVRADIANRRSQGEQIGVGQELTAAALSALAEFGGERIGLGAMTNNRRFFTGKIAQKVSEYAVSIGVNATEEMVTQVAQNAVDRYITDNQNTELTDGVARAGLVGGAIGGIGRGIVDANQNRLNAQSLRGQASQPVQGPQGNPQYPLSSGQPQAAPVPQPVQDGRVPVEQAVDGSIPFAGDKYTTGEPVPVYSPAQTPGEPATLNPPGNDLPPLLKEKELKFRQTKGDKSSGLSLEFESPSDKALYALTFNRQGKVQAEARSYLEGQGLNADAINSGVAEVKARVETRALAPFEGSVLRIDAVNLDGTVPFAGPNTSSSPTQLPLAPQDSAPIPLAKPEANAVNNTPPESSVTKSGALAYPLKTPRQGAKVRPASPQPTPPANTGQNVPVEPFNVKGDVALPAGQKRDVRGQEGLFLPDEQQVAGALDTASREVKGFRREKPANAEQASVAKQFAGLGVKLEYYSGEGRGVRLGQHDRVLFINKKNVGADLQEAVSHEFMHELKQSRPGLFQEFLSAMPESVKAEMRADYEQMYSKFRPGEQLSPAKLDEEAVTTSFGRIAMNPRVWQAAMGQKPGLLGRIVDALRSFAAKFSGNSRMIQQAIKTFEATINSPVGGNSSPSTASPQPARETPDQFRTSPQRRYTVTDTADFLPTPTPVVQEQAKKYAQEAGLSYDPDTSYAEVDVARAKKIAQWYDQAQSQPSDPAVKASYDAMKRETLAQYKFLEKSGVRFEPWRGGGQPYANSKEMLADVREHQHLFFFPTEGGFGSDKSFDASANPLVEKTGERAGGIDLTYNDMFRAVHDYFGHATNGVGFGPRGEENAWRSHSQMFSPAARPAMSAETRGQNSWVNYGPKGKANQATPKDTQFADQKAVIMPPQWTSVEREGTADFLPPPPETKYGYWFNAKEKAFTVVDDSHEDTASEQGWKGTGNALADGLVRIVAGPKSNGLGVEVNFEHREKLLDLSPYIQDMLEAGKVADIQVNGEDPLRLDGMKIGSDMARLRRYAKGESPYFLPSSGRERDKSLAGLNSTRLMGEPVNSTPGLFGANRAAPGSVLKEEVARILNDWTKKLAGTAKSRESEKLQRAIAAGTPEIEYQLQQKDSGKQWYKEDIAKMEATMRKLHPSLKKAENMTIFKALLAITSQGNNPFVNLKHADPIYSHWVETGTILKKQPNGKNWPGTLGENYSLPLTRLSALIEQYGVKGAAKWLLTKHTVEAINGFSESLGLRGNVKGKMADEHFGFEIFGPKIGVFALNQHGIQEKVTKDMWFSRTWNRWMGTMLDKGEIVDAPRTDAEREVMDAAVRNLSTASGIEPMEVQAVLWYYEQQLWRAHGAKANSGSYSVSAQRVLNGDRYDLKRAFLGGDGGTSEEDGSDSANNRLFADDGGGGGESGDASFLPPNPLSRHDGLPEEITRLNDVRRGKIEGENTRGRFAAFDLRKAIRGDYGVSANKLPPSDIQSLNEELKGGTPAAGPGASGALGKMREHLDELSSRLEASDFISPELRETVGANLGKWLNRSFRVFDDPKWEQKIPDEVKADAINFIGGQLIAQGKSVDQAPVYVEQLMKDWKAGGVERLFAGKVGAKNLGILTTRKDLAPQIRALMGEYTNPFVNYAKSVSKLGTLLANHEYLQGVREAGLGKWLFEDGSAIPGYTTEIAAPSSSTMAPLNGLRTSPEIAAAFQQMNESGTPAAWVRILTAANFAAKSAKTVYSLMTQVRNVTGQPFFNLLNGHFRVAKYGEAFKATAADATGGGSEEIRRHIVDLHRLGVFGNSVQANDILADLDQMGLKNSDIVPDADGFLPLTRRLAIDAVKLPAKAYQLSDALGKAYGFANELARQKAINPQLSLEDQKTAAAERVVNTYPTYSRIPPKVRLLRNQPFFGPFVSFWYEAMRTTGNSAIYAYQDLVQGKNAAQRQAGAERLVGMTIVGAGFTAVMKASMAALGITGDEDKGFRKFLPEWSRNNTFLYTGKDGKGNLQYVDLSGMNPYSQIVDSLHAAVASEGDLQERMVNSVSEFFAPLMGEQLFTAAMVDVARNKTATGARVFNPEDDGIKVWGAKLGHILSSLEPGTLDRLRNRIVPGLKGEETSYGDKLVATREIAAEVTGIRLKDFNFASGLSFQARKWGGAGGDVTGLFLREVTRPGTLDKGRVLSAYRDMENRRFKNWSDLHDKVIAAGRGGLSVKDIYQSLVRGGVSPESAKAVMTGQYKPYNLKSDAIRAAFAQHGKDIPLAEMAILYRENLGRRLGEDSP